MLQVTQSILNVLCLFIVKCEYILIWHDNMETGDSWRQERDDIRFGSRSSGCFDGKCVRLIGLYGISPRISRLTNISDYVSIQLQFDVSNSDMKPSVDYCQVSYGFNSSPTGHLLQSYSGEENQRTYYKNQTFVINIDSSAINMWISFEVNVDTEGSDRCYWDDVYLRGVRIPLPVTTVSPTLVPSQPNYTLSAVPTRVPSATKVPTRVPSATKVSTNAPYDVPTDAPSYAIPIRLTISFPTMNTVYSDISATSNRYIDEDNATENQDGIWMVIMAIVIGMICLCCCLRKQRRIRQEKQLVALQMCAQDMKEKNEKGIPQDKQTSDLHDVCDVKTMISPSTKATNGGKDENNIMSVEDVTSDDVEESSDSEDLYATDHVTNTGNVVYNVAIVDAPKNDNTINVMEGMKDMKHKDVKCDNAAAECGDNRLYVGEDATVYICDNT